MNNEEQVEGDNFRVPGMFYTDVGKLLHVLLTKLKSEDSAGNSVRKLAYEPAGNILDIFIFRSPSESSSDNLFINFKKNPVPCGHLLHYGSTDRVSFGRIHFHGDSSQQKIRICFGRRNPRRIKEPSYWGEVPIGILLCEPSDHWGSGLPDRNAVVLCLRISVLFSGDRQVSQVFL